MNKRVILLIIIIIVAMSISAFRIPLTKNAFSPVDESANTVKPLFGTMLAFSTNDAMMGMPGGPDVLQKGWTEFKKDSSAYQNLKNNLKKLIQDRIKLVQMTGFSLDREIVPYFTWNVIEPQRGQFDWELTDLYVQAASGVGVKISAVIQPFAHWDQKNTLATAGCNALDFAFYDYKAGPPHDIVEYENFLTKTVERYKDQVAVWEIGNEVEGDCGGYKNNPQGYVALLKISYETIKKANPQAIVINGGALEFGEIRSFWQQFFALGGGQYIDYFNLHYNKGRSPDARLDPAAFQEDLMFFNNLMGNNGGKKPLYLTEFGIYSGSPPSQPFGQPIQEINQESQAVLYFKYSILAFANGVKVVFIDLVGPDNGVIGSSMAFNTNDKPRLFLATLKTIESKIGGFSRAEKIADGQYKFTIGSKTVYALWSGTLPNEISGKVKRTDMKGQKQIMDATGITLKADQPIFIE